MKYVLLVLMILLSSQVAAQEWISDADFEAKISGKDKFGDDSDIVVVEFYAEFNKDNAFADWDKLKGVKYYRCNLADSPDAKKKYKVRMAPTIIIFKEGIKEQAFKAGLDLECPVELPELSEAIADAKKASQF